MRFSKVASFALGPAITGVLGLITVPYLTWHLTQADLGQYTFYLATLSFCIAFFPFGLDQAFIREYYETANKNKLFFTAAIPGTIVFIAIYILTTGFTSLNTFILGDEATEVEFIFFASVVISMATRFLFLPIRMEGNGILFSLGQILPRTFLIIYLISNSLIGNDINIAGLLYAWAAGLFIQLLFLVVANTLTDQNLKLTFVDCNLLYKSLSYSIPLMLSSMAYWGLTLTDRVLLRVLSSFEQLGIYSVVINFASVAIMFQTVFTTLWSPLLFKWHSNDLVEENTAYVSSFVSPLFLLFCFLIVFLSPYITLVLGQGYDQIATLLPLCIMPAFLYTISEIGACQLQIKRRSVLILHSVLIGLITNLLFGYFLVKVLGNSGAAISTAISFWVMYFFKMRNAINIGSTNYLGNFSFISLITIAFLSVYSVWGEAYVVEVAFASLILSIGTLICFRHQFIELYHYVRGKR